MKKTPPSTRAKKIAGKCLYRDFSQASEDPSPNPTDPTISSPESEISVIYTDGIVPSFLNHEFKLASEDPSPNQTDPTISSPESEIAVIDTDGIVPRCLNLEFLLTSEDPSPEPTISSPESEIAVIDNEGKTEISPLTETSGCCARDRAQRLGLHTGEANRSSNLVFLEGLRIGTLCFLICFVVVMIVLVVLFSHINQISFSGLPPT